MNHLSDKQCRYCGSTMLRRAGSPHCSSDNLPTVKYMFDNILSLEFVSPEEFSRKLSNLQSNELTFDLFTDYWKKKKLDPTVNLICLHEDTYFRDIHVDSARLPLPDPYIPFPDLIEVYIAEIMLGRELTDLEKDGSIDIPKIDQETGNEYFAPLTWVKFPHSYISLKDMVIKTDYTEDPLPKVFDIDQIRGKYSSRPGRFV